MTSLAEAMRRTGQTLRDEGNDTPAKVTDAVAERADRLGSYLRDADGDAILRDVENLVRRQPWLFAAGGLVLGMVASRFLKTSSGRRYESSNGGSAQGPPPVVRARGPRSSSSRTSSSTRRSERAMARNGEADAARAGPVGELLEDLATEMTTLLRQEIDLAKAEFGEKGRKAGLGFEMWGAAAVVGLLALGAERPARR